MTEIVKIGTAEMRLQDCMEYMWLLKNYAKPGQRILDTHLGSMSSVIACLNHGFEIVGCELDADYFKAGTERVRNSQKQQKLEI